MTEIRKLDLDGKTIYVKDNKIFGPKVVYPYKNEDGTINWFNLMFGGKGNLISSIITLGIVVMLLIGFGSQLNQCRDMAANPCKYFDCNSFGNVLGPHVNISAFNFSAVNSSVKS